MSRKVENDGSRYFGPFSPAGRARSTIRLVNKYFGVRGCEDAVFRGRKRPCLEHDLGLCSAPCVGLHLRGRLPEGRGERPALSRGPDRGAGPEPEGAAWRKRPAAQRFEEAARRRDLIRTLEDLRREASGHRRRPRGPGRGRLRPVGERGGPPRLLHEAGEGPGFRRDVRRKGRRDAPTAISWPSSSGGSMPGPRSPRRSSCPSSRPALGAFEEELARETGKEDPG